MKVGRMIFDMLCFLIVLLFIAGVIGWVTVAYRYFSERKIKQELKRLNEMLDCFLRSIENSNKKEGDF